MNSTIGQAVFQAGLILFSLALSTTINYASSYKGTYQLNKVEVDEVKSIASIQVSNYDGNELEDIKILVPDELTTSDIKSSIPIKVNLTSDSLSSPNDKILTLSLVPANKTIVLMIPYKTGLECCQILNPGQVGISVVDGDYSPNALWQAFKYAAISIFIYSIFFMLGVYDSAKRAKSIEKEMSSRISETKAEFETIKKEKDERYQLLKEELERRNEESRQDTEDLKSTAREMKDELLSVQKVAARFRVINLRRLEDYKRELQFWKDTIRKMLYTGDGKDEKTQILFNIVTDSLKSYSTKENSTLSLTELNHIVEIKKEDVDGQTD